MLYLAQSGTDMTIALAWVSDDLGWRFVAMPKADVVAGTPYNSKPVYPVEIVTVNNDIDHEFGTSYEKDATGHWYECTCGAKKDAADHSYGAWTVSKAPTATVDGKRSRTCSVCGYVNEEDLPAGPDEGVYYLTATVNGVKYYVRAKVSGESVTHTLPYSMFVSSNADDAMNLSLFRMEGAFRIGWMHESWGQMYYIMYVSEDGYVHIGEDNVEKPANMNFSWDKASQLLYQEKEGVKYVLAVTEMTRTDGEKEMRLVAVPMTELDAATVAVKLELMHKHSFGTDWVKTATSHYHVCGCGEKAEEGAHNVTNWTVTKDPTETTAGEKTGSCAVCGYAMKAVIPATGSKAEAPKKDSAVYVYGVINGVKYYLRYQESGESVTSTTPYSMYTTTKLDEAEVMTVRVEDGVYRLEFFKDPWLMSIYISGDGVGPTDYDNESIVSFTWDEENGVLYRDLNGVKYVLVFKTMQNSRTGASEVRMTAMPLAEAQADANVSIAMLVDESAATGDASMVDLGIALMLVSLMSVVALVGKKKFF